jgi:ribonuclease-3
MTTRDLTPLQSALGITFRDQSLLRLALVHRSYLNETAGPRHQSNERLEFLGDAVLGFVVAQRLYRELPEASEGTLTTIRAALVRMETLYAAADRLGLGPYLVLGRGEALTGGRTRRQILGSAFEAIIGAAYLDGGPDSATRVIWTALEEPFREMLRSGPPKDVKSRLQELVQARMGETPTYQHSGPEGGEHDRRFGATVVVQGRVLGSGAGPTKRDAERAAAREAFSALLNAPLTTQDPPEVPGT